MSGSAKNPLALAKLGSAKSGAKNGQHFTTASNGHKVVYQKVSGKKNVVVGSAPTKTAKRASTREAYKKRRFTAAATIIQTAKRVVASRRQCAAKGKNDISFTTKSGERIDFCARPAKKKYPLTMPGNKLKEAMMKNGTHKKVAEMAGKMRDARLARKAAGLAPGPKK